MGPEVDGSTVGVGFKEGGEVKGQDEEDENQEGLFR